LTTGMIGKRLSGMNASLTACLSPLKKGALVGTPKRGQGTKRMVLADARVLRLEYTWSRRPRRKSGSLPTLKNGRLGATAPSAADLNACLQIEVMTATRSALGWSSKALSRSSQLGAITPSLRIRTEASSGDTSADGLLSVGTHGCTTSGAGSSATNVRQRFLPP
jgi:hypothetical protein